MCKFELPEDIEGAMYTNTRKSPLFLSSSRWNMACILPDVVSGGRCRDITLPIDRWESLYGNDRCPLLCQANHVIYRPPILTGCNNSCLCERSFAPHHSIPSTKYVTSFEQGS